MEPEQEYTPAEEYEDEEAVMDDDNYEPAADGADQEEYEYQEEAEERIAETDDVAIMDTQTGEVIHMQGEMSCMDIEAVDVGCKDSPPIPDKVARDLNEDDGQLRSENQDDPPRKTPEKLKLPKDGKWHSEEPKQPAVDEKAPPIPIKRGNTKSRIQMFEAM